MRGFIRIGVNTGVSAAAAAAAAGASRVQWGKLGGGTCCVAVVMRSTCGCLRQTASHAGAWGRQIGRKWRRGRSRAIMRRDNVHTYNGRLWVVPQT